MDYDVHEILDQNKIVCNIQNDQSNSGFTLKSFSTRKINDLYFQKPIGIYSEYNIASFSDDMIDNIFLNSQINCNKSISRKRDKERGNSISTFKMVK